MYSLSAGQETTSNHLSFTLYEILKHPNIEDRYDGYGLYTICLLLQRSLSLLFFIRSSLMMFIIYTSRQGSLPQQATHIITVSSW